MKENILFASHLYFTINNYHLQSIFSYFSNSFSLKFLKINPLNKPVDKSLHPRYNADGGGFMNGVIYARYSSDNQREESIEGQLRECQAFAEKNDITIMNTYIDRAFSAKTDNRPEFQHMISDSKKKMFDVVLVWKYDRFARNRLDSLMYKQLLQRNNIKLISVTEPIMNSSVGIIVESMIDSYNEYYSAELAEKVTRGMTENALKGKYNGGTLPIGYIIDDDKYFQIDPLTAPIVLEAFQKYDEGMTMKKIVDYLRLKGLRTKKNGEISINSLTRMLHNRRYIGEYKFQDIVTPDVIPAIVPQDLFDRVQEKLAKNKKAPARKKAEDEYLLTTKLYCGKCGCYMVGESGTSQQKKIVHRYYKCVSVKNHKGCDKKTVKKDWIEDLTLEMIKRIIFDDRMLDSLADEIINYLGQESTLLPQLRKQLKDCEKGIDNLLNAIQMGIFTPSTKERLESLEQQKEELQIRIAQEEIIKPPIDKDKILFWLHRFRKLDTTKLEHRKRLIDSFVNVIYLYDDKIVFTFNYKDGSKTITMEEIESSALSSDLTSLGAPKTARFYRAVLLFIYKK